MGLFEEIQKKIEQAVAASQEQQRAARQAANPQRPQPHVQPQAQARTQPVELELPVLEDSKPEHIALKDRHQYGSDFSTVNEQSRQKAESRKSELHKKVGRLERRSDEARIDATEHNDHLHVLRKLLKEKNGVSALILGQEILGPPLSKRRAPRN
ncbi:MAG: hypothetical protein HRU15_17310 [Planctomycetes bacterium]|nr:hypothetical protein [Planctomycetota bacterium]